ncbi:ABC transporter ATP-binding protein [Salegentibacter sp. Hel_I_6]|uniref:ABC transporter ATP-binding protein n=1 Tax=Salegentibacter sp. Hel_I_6 TaxID=1250278 RepID=UPI000A97846B|nr:ABC transporter ATP-binding protein [Salegentibacter sp. Hel_I_6]
MFLSLLTGVLDGLGLALFIPLLQIVFKDTAERVPKDQTDALSSFLLENFNVEFTLTGVFIVILILFSIKGAVKFLEGYLGVLWQQKMMKAIRFNNIDLLSQFKYPAFVNTDAGKIQNTLGGEVSKISLAHKYYFKTIQFGVLVFVYFALSMRVDWKFTLLVIIGGIFINLLSKFLYKRTKYFSRKLVTENHRYHKLLLEKINLFKYLKATGLIENYAKKLKSSILSMEEVQRRLGMVNAALFGIREPLVILVIFGAIFFYSQVFGGLVSSILLSLLLIYRAFNYFMASQEQWNLFLGNSGSLNNLQNFTSELEKNREPQAGGKPIYKFEKEILLKNVSFGYGKDIILKNINLKVKKNESLAIVGSSGSGKSTLMNLLSGILVPNSGEVLIDEIPMDKLDMQSFKKRIGYIVQDATIFNDTIFNNISFWQPKNKDNIKRFNNAIKKAKIDDFINNLEKKEDNLLGVNGINVSGGQKQRISIARELYKDIDILFLDEATSSLDTETEFEIQKNIDELKGQYTFIIIAHRLATIKNADRIILLENGQIQGIGTYRELLANSLSFQKMVQLQEV